MFPIPVQRVVLVCSRGTPDLETVCWSGVNSGGQRSFMGKKAGQVLQGVVYCPGKGARRK